LMCSSLTRRTRPSRWKRDALSSWATRPNVLKSNDAFIAWCVQVLPVGLDRPAESGMLYPAELRDQMF